MIRIYFSFDTGLFHLSFPKSHIYFDDLVAFCKAQHLRYFPVYKEWGEEKAIRVMRYLDELKAYGEIQISEEDQYLISDSIYPAPKNLIRTKFPLDQEFLKKFSPIVGKPGFEDFQLQCIRHGLSQNHAIFDVGVGHGKTYIQTSILHHLLWKNKADKFLWVCKFEGLLNTKLEILRFLGEHFSEDDIAIVTTENRCIEDFFDKKVIIISYNTFRLASMYYYSEAHKPKRAKKPKSKVLPKKKAVPKRPRQGYINFSSWGEKRVLIMDEGQSLKHHETQINHHIKLYSDQFWYQYVLSGTLGYSLGDYFSICKIFCDDLIPFTPSDWKDYVYGKDRRQVTTPIPERAKEFKERVIDRYQISFHDAINVPDMIEKEIYLEMTSEMKSLYRKFVEKALERTRGDEEVEGMQLANVFPYLLQFTSDPSLVASEFGSSWDFRDSPKIEAVLSLLETWIEEQDKKVIIWTGYPRIANALGVLLKKHKPLIIHGDEKTSVRREDRSALVEAWRRDPESKLAIFTYVVSTSINIPEVNRQIYFDNITDADPRDQSKGRTRRATSTEPTISVYLLYNQSLDIYVYYEILKKKSSVKKVLNSRGELSLEDYKKVFNAKAERYTNKEYQSVKT